MNRSHTDYVYRLFGQFFGLELLLNGDNDTGYSIKHVSRFRIPWTVSKFGDRLHFDQADRQLLTRKVAKDLIPDAKTTVRRTKPDFELTGKALLTQTKPSAYLELDFSGIRLLTETQEETADFEFSNLINEIPAEQLTRDGVEYSKAISSLQTSPVLTDTQAHRRFHRSLVSLVTQLVELDLTGVEQIIVGGELVWSGWLDLPLILSVLNDCLIGHPAQVYIDYAGIWYMLARNKADRANPLFFIKSTQLDPHLTWVEGIPPQKNKAGLEITLEDESGTGRKLILEEHRICLFDLGGSKHLLQGLELAPNVYIHNKPLELEKLSQEGFERWWRDTELAKQVMTDWSSLGVPQLLTNQSTDFIVSPGDSFEFDHSLKKGLDVNLGEKIGSCLIRTLHMHRTGSEVTKYMKVSDGEYVKPGQEMTVKPVAGGLWATPVKSSVAGKVDLSLLDHGIVLVETEKNTDAEANFSGTVQASFGSSGYRIFGKNAVAIPVHTSTHDHLEGELVTDLYTETDRPKALIVPNLGAFDTPLEELLAEHVHTVIILEASYTELLRSVSGDPRWRWVGMGLVSAPDQSADKEVVRIIKRHVGQYVSGTKDLLFLQMRKEEVLAESMQNEKLSGDIAVTPYLPAKGEHVQVFAYSSKDAYARIERATTTDVNELLISVSDGIESVPVGNTLPT